MHRLSRYYNIRSDVARSRVSLQHIFPDGKNFQLITQQPLKIAQKTDPIKRVPISLNFAKTKTRYVKVVLKGTVIPEWHEGKGTPAVLFVDEIQLM